MNTVLLYDVQFLTQGEGKQPCAWVLESLEV